MTHDAQDIWPIFIVSLSDATLRRSTISSALGDRGLPFDFIDAVDGRRGLGADHEKDIDRDKTVETMGRPLSDVEYACALSHASIYRRILAEGLPGAIILEDDAILTPLFDEFVAVAGWTAGDLVQLDHLHGDVWRGDTPIRLTENITLRRAARNASMANGYTISARGAVYFLDNGLPLCGPADWPVDPTRIGALLATPRIIEHAPQDSDDSSLEDGRARLSAGLGAGSRVLRFFRASYWRRWWFKRRTQRIS